MKTNKEVCTWTMFSAHVLHIHVHVGSSEQVGTFGAFDFQERSPAADGLCEISVLKQTVINVGLCLQLGQSHRNMSLQHTASKPSEQDSALLLCPKTGTDHATRR